MDTFNAIIAVVTALLTLPLGALGLFVFNWWQAKKTSDLASKSQVDTNNLQQNDQAVKFYKEFVEQFKNDFQHLEKDYFAVKEELIKLKAECECPEKHK